jgi:hypothetical protein
MIVQIDIGGVVVSFGEAQQTSPPEPFYPYLLSVGTINDTVGDTETGSATFTLHKKAKDLLGLSVRRKVSILNDALEVVFEGITGTLQFNEAIDVTVEA